MQHMKFAISVPDPLFLAADAHAKQAGKSRSQLFAEAMAAYLDAHGDADVTRRLDEVYSTLDSRLDPALRRQAATRLENETW